MEAADLHCRYGLIAFDAPGCGGRLLSQPDMSRATDRPKKRGCP
jgi:hypothetical protein